MTKVKVVHVLGLFPSQSETFVINFILETLKHNYSAQILADTIRPLEVSSQQDLLTKSGLFSSAQTFNPNVPEDKLKRLFFAISLLFKNIKFSRVLLRTLNKKRYGLKSQTLKMWFQAATFLKYRDAEVFHAHFGINGKLLAEMKEIGAIKGKIITSFYGYDTFSTDETQEHFINYYLGAFKASKQIVTSSNYLFNNLLKLNVPKGIVFVNPVGVDIDIFNYKNRSFDGSLKIITVGRLIKLKGQHVGIEVIKLLIERGYNVHYTIVGTGTEYEILKQKIKSLNLEDFITLRGGGTQNEIIELLDQNHLFLMTSITDETGRAEGQGLVTAEAQASGLPVVGFNSGGIPETIRDGITGYVVEEGNVKAMANSIEKFISHPELITTMGLEARSYIEQHFNNATQSQKIIDLYKQ
ncbi:glycosyltransferase [Winogradskyella sp. PG-2]|uniref:glycosyltransferase n=1 Tax=Winogradskyella sp. PG-2 TaxID=754409 RepID=UPI001494A16D|nr:glycosyltransferase [Winogradskyella sp. PG-2]